MLANTEDGAISRGRGLWGVLFPALLALTLFVPVVAGAQQVKQIKLTAKQIESFIAADKDMSSLREGADPDKPDPKIEAQAAAVAKKNGFASLDEYDNVSTNISLVFYGIDPQTSSSPSRPSASRRKSRRSRPTNRSRRRKRSRIWRTSRRRSRPRSPFSSKTTSRWC